MIVCPSTLKKTVQQWFEEQKVQEVQILQISLQRPISQLTGLKGSIANIMVPDTTSHLQILWSQCLHRLELFWWHEGHKHNFRQMVLTLWLKGVHISALWGSDSQSVLAAFVILFTPRQLQSLSPLQNVCCATNCAMHPVHSWSEKDQMSGYEILSKYSQKARCLRVYHVKYLYTNQFQYINI